MTVQVKMIHGSNFWYRDKKYTRFGVDKKTPRSYTVSQKLAYELLQQKTPRGVPYFALDERAILGEQAPPPPPPEPEDEIEVEFVSEDVEQESEEEEEGEDPEPPVVKPGPPKKKAGKKKVIRKKGPRPRRMTSSKEGDDGESEEV